MIGAADHAGESRWSWQQVDWNRRVDLLGTPDGVLLVVTELSLCLASRRGRSEFPTEPVRASEPRRCRLFNRLGPQQSSKL